MKTVRYYKYGSPEVMQIEDADKPGQDKDRVLLRVLSSSINAGDYRVRTAKPAIMRLMIGGFFKPKDPRLGSDVAGVVEAVGENVTKFKAGDEVFGCAYGAFSEFVLAKPANLVPKPPGRSFEESAAVPVAALTALQGLRDTAKIQSGERILIQGASGGVGTFTVQLAKHFGAEVTAVCSTRNLELMRSIGADHVIDYTQENFTERAERYDLIFAVNGYHPLSAYKRALTPQGRYVCAGGTLAQIFQSMLLGPLMSERGGRRLINMGISNVNQEDLVTLAELFWDGRISPIIDRTYPLDEIVEAFRYVEAAHPRGKVVITMK